MAVDTPLEGERGIEGEGDRQQMAEQIVIGQVRAELPCGFVVGGRQGFVGRKDARNTLYMLLEERTIGRTFGGEVPEVTIKHSACAPWRRIGRER